jgi:hypothetical protein
MGNIVTFFEGGRHPSGYSLDDIYDWEVHRLESTHDYIQWMFPLNEPSMAQPDSPVLDLEDVEWIASEHRSTLIESALFFVQFLKGGTVLGAVNYWVTPFNHNQPRITRMLKCLKLHGLDILAEIIYKWVVSQDTVHGSFERALPYWDDAIKG